MRRALLALAAVLLLAGCAPVSRVPPEPTGAELEALIAKELDFQWQYVGLTPDAPRPTVQRIRIVSMEEAQQVHRDCMREAGYEGNRINTSSTFGASSYERLAIHVCSAQYPVPPSAFGLFSEAQLDYLYDYYVDVTIPCMAASGVSVASIPSRQQFVAPATQLQQIWMPYLSVTTDQDLTVLMNEKCPYVPEGFTNF